VTKNIKGLLHALQQSINEAILESNDVAAAMAALKRTGKCPVFTIDISMQDPFGEASEPIDAPKSDPSDDPEDEPAARPRRLATEDRLSTEELVLSDSDVEFLTAIGIRDPSWSQSTSISPTD
jgi:hypothetical protein